MCAGNQAANHRTYLKHKIVVTDLLCTATPTNWNHSMSTPVTRKDTPNAHDCMWHPTAGASIGCTRIGTSTACYGDIDGSAFTCSNVYCRAPAQKECHRASCGRHLFSSQATIGCCGTTRPTQKLPEELVVMPSGKPGSWSTSNSFWPACAQPASHQHATHTSSVLNHQGQLSHIEKWTASPCRAFDSAV